MVQTHIQTFLKSGERWSNKPTPPSCTKYSISGFWHCRQIYESTFQTTPDFSFSLVMRCKGKGKTYNHVLKKKKSYLWLEKEWLNSPWSQNQNSLCMQNHIHQKELRSLLKDLSQLPHIHIYMTFDRTFTHQSARQTLINRTHSTPIMWIFKVKQDI